MIIDKDYMKIFEKPTKRVIHHNKKWYSYKYTNNFIIIRILIRVNILFHINIMDYYINTIDDMQKEMDFFYHCKKFEHNHDFEIFS